MAELYNAPNLSALSYRVGTHPTFLQRMLDNLRTQTIPPDAPDGERPLAALTTRDSDDPAIALLDAWAVVGDVLTFYQERIANESYLRTATEQRSVVELADTIGYQLEPGVAASTYLVFTVERSPDDPAIMTLLPGIQVQSVPGQDELPQTFETVEEIDARVEWNLLQPYKPTKEIPPEITGNSTALRLAGSDTSLQEGDHLLLLGEIGESDDPSKAAYFLTLQTVALDEEESYTEVTWGSTLAENEAGTTDSSDQPLSNPQLFVLRQQATLFGYDAPQWEDMPEEVKIEKSGVEGGVYGLDGDEWQPMQAGLPTDEVQALAAYSRQGGTESTDYLFAGTAGGGVFRSTDNGTNWEACNTGLTNLMINALFADQRLYLFAGTTDGTIFFSTDDGDNWTPLSTGSLVQHTIVVKKYGGKFNVKPFPDELKIRGVHEWKLVQDGLPNTAIRALNSYEECDQRYLFVGTNDGIYRSQDYDQQTGLGTVWERLNSEGKCGDLLNQLPCNDTFHALANTSSDFYAATDDAIYKKAIRPLEECKNNEEEKLFVKITTSNSINGIRALLIDEDQNKIWAGTRNGLYQADLTTPLNWESVAHGGLPNDDFRALAIIGSQKFATTPLVIDIAEDWPGFEISGQEIDLDEVYPTVFAGTPLVPSWAVLTNPSLSAGNQVMAYSIMQVLTVLRDDITDPAKSTRLTLDPADGLSSFGGSNLRGTEVWIESEPLPLFKETVPQSKVFEGDRIETENWVPELEAGRSVAVVGKRVRGRLPEMERLFSFERQDGTWTAWHPLHAGLKNCDVNALAGNSESGIYHLFAGSTKGVLYSKDNGHSWEEKNNGLTNLDVRALLIHHPDAQTNRPPLYITKVSMLIEYRCDIYAGTSAESEGGLFRYIKHIKSWEKINCDNNRKTMSFNCFSVEPDGKKIYTGTTGGGVLCSGNTWQAMNEGLTNLDVRALLAYELQSQSQSYLLAGTFGGGIFGFNHGTEKWEEMGLDKVNVTALAINSDHNLFAGTDGEGVYRSVDNGQEWRQINSGLTNFYVRTLLLYQSDGTDYLLAGTEGGGVFSYLQVENHWQEINTGLANDVRCLLRNDESGEILAGTGHKSILVANDGTIKGIDSEELLQVMLSPAKRDDGLTSWTLQDHTGFTGMLMSGPKGDTEAKEELILQSALESDGTVSEMAVVKEMDVQGPRGKITWREPLKNSYDPDTVIIRANVALATHGETIADEVQGSGDGSQANQRFTLKDPPLTYVSTGGDVKSSLALRINDVLWSETRSLHNQGPRSQSYMVRQDSEGESHLIFGDGQRGARLPSGIENVVATYRSGIGLEGNVNPNTLTLLQSAPLNVEEVSNPISATGGAAPETVDSARQSAPLTVLTMDRVVSLLDFEYFARTFPGIGKAKAASLWTGQNFIVHLTIGDNQGEPVDPSSTLYQNLKAGLDKRRNALQPMQIDSYEPLYFNLEAQIFVDPRYETEKVLNDVKSALLQEFAFQNRDFGQDVAASEVIDIIQTRSGVVWVDLEFLYSEGSRKEEKPLLTAESARWSNGQALAAQLLLFNPKDPNAIKLTAKTES